MKRLILLLITLVKFANVSYASFAVLKETKPKVEVSQPNSVIDENRKILLLSLVPTIFTNVSYASSPVTETQQIEIVETTNVELPTYKSEFG